MTVYRMGGELVPQGEMKAWHNDRGIAWGTPYQGPDPVEMRAMIMPQNLTVHLANEHAIDPVTVLHGREVEHMFAHLRGVFRAGQGHYHREVSP